MITSIGTNYRYRYSLPVPVYVDYTKGYSNNVYLFIVAVGKIDQSSHHTVGYVHVPGLAQLHQRLPKTPAKSFATNKY
jgi:hypothetical protein